MPSGLISGVARLPLFPPSHLSISPTHTLASLVEFSFSSFYLLAIPSTSFSLSTYLDALLAKYSWYCVCCFRFLQASFDYFLTNAVFGRLFTASSGLKRFFTPRRLRSSYIYWLSSCNLPLNGIWPIHSSSQINNRETENAVSFIEGQPGILAFF